LSFNVLTDKIKIFQQEKNLEKREEWPEKRPSKKAGEIIG